MSVEILAMGDWGAPPNMPDPDDVPKVRALQNQVASAMADYARKLAEKGTPLSAVFGLGDNFYGRLDGPDDPRFQERLEKLYPPADLNVPFYFALGNHDYEDYKFQNWKHEIAYAKQHPESRWKWPAADGVTWFRQDFPSDEPIVIGTS